MDHLLIAILSGTLAAATPLLYASLGELVAERSGVLNLGVEGMMLIGAVTAFGMRVAGHGLLPAVAAAAAAGATAAFIFAVLALTLAANQIAAGLALTILCSGLSAYLGRDYGSATLPALAHVRIAALSDLPVLGPTLFAQDPMVYFAWALAAGVWVFLFRTQAGLVLRSIGEAPQTAEAIGYSVIRVRYAATLFGGALAGLGGAYLSVSLTPLWVEDMTAGRGWIALALVVFAAWRPWRLILGAWLFGGVTVLQLFAQALGINVPSELLSALPYLATIIVLVAISRGTAARRLQAPLSLAQPFRSQR